MDEILAIVFLAAAIVWLMWPDGPEQTTIPSPPYKEEVADIAPAVIEPTVVEPPKPEEPKIVDESKECPSTPVDATFIHRTFSALALEKNRKNFHEWRNDYGNEQHDPENIYASFSYNGKLYTVWNNTPSIIDGEIYMDGWIAVWERPIGSRGDKSLETYSDHRADGCVNHGLGHRQFKLMTWLDIDNRVSGIEHHGYWQERYARAIRGLAAKLDID